MVSSARPSTAGVGEPTTLVGLVARGAREYPDRSALLIRPGFRTLTWTYADLADIVPRAARLLHEAGLGHGDRVILWAVNRPEWVIAFLAAGHVGAVVVPLDVRHAHDFAGRVTARTEAQLVIAGRQTAEGARSLGLPIVWLETLRDAARRAAPLDGRLVQPGDLAEIVFTSGTTGEPKGAMISHGNLMASAVACARVFPIGPNERLISVLPLSHLFEQGLGLITPLLVGASIVYPVSRQPAVLMRTFRDYSVSMLLIVPQGLRLLDNAIERQVEQAGRRAAFEGLHRLARPWPARVRRLLFRPVLGRLGGRLHSIGVGASALDTDLAERWQRMGVQVLQGYGATEMSPAISFTRPGRNRLGTVGEPVPGVELRILDDGEILVRGPSRFLGYWRAPEATAAAIDADGWYHTGDLGALSPEGLLTLKGRKKDMIALPDGQKVYPEDVEAALLLDARLTDACVLGWPGGADLRVHAVLLVADPAAAADVVRAANARLGAHQQIRGWTVWPDEDLPRTHALKVKRFVVVERLAALAADGQSGAPPRAIEMAGGHGRGPTTAAVPAPDADPLHVLVAGVAGVSVDAVATSSRLSTDLDLDSLQRVELLGVIEEELGIYVDDDAVDPDATVAELVAIVAAARGDEHAVGAHRWPLNPVVRAIGMALQPVVVRTWARFNYRFSVQGLEHLADLEGPVLFTPNHCLHPDVAIVLTVLPRRWRWKLSIAAAADDIFGNPLQGFGVSVLANAFPLAREGAVRRSLELLGTRLDRGFSILIFPEGKLTVGGPMQPLKSGVGLIAVEGALPVVPIKLDIVRLARIDAPGNPRRGEVVVRIGAPMRFDAETDPIAATAELEARLRAM
jgi:long-chain acyl-CoA synthetase